MVEIIFTDHNINTTVWCQVIFMKPFADNHGVQFKIAFNFFHIFPDLQTVLSSASLHS